MINNIDKLLLAPLFLGGIPLELALKVKMKHRIYVARLWVECYDYQSNTVILGELVLRLRWELPHVSGREGEKATKREAVR